mmetsp:Transcript_42506/g.117297  ORF Transcript_42506/g.117297 Transcript_42506/m.117297 type:complete len:403 (+) Transcript_42506:97-1305(+)
MKRPAEDMNDGRGQKRPPRTRYCMKALCPDELVMSLMGPRGSTKDQIHHETGSKLVFSNKDDYYPGTRFRVLGFYAETVQSILAAVQHLIQATITLGQQELVNPPAHGLEYTGKEEGEFLIRMCIPKAAFGELIGPKGSRIKELRAETGCKVFIENDTFAGHQMVRIIGPAEMLQSCTERVIGASQTDAGSEDYQNWAQILNFSDLDVGGYQGGGRTSRPRAAEAEAPPQDAWGGHVTEARYTDGAGDAHQGGGGGGKRRGGGGPPEKASESVMLLDNVVRGFPEGTSGLLYSISFGLPLCHLQTLLENQTLAQLEESFSVQLQHPQPAETDDPWSIQPISLVGTLLNMYTAHITLHKLVKQIEQEAAAAEQQEVLEEEDPQVLKAKIAELQAQLAGIAGKK